MTKPKRTSARFFSEIAASEVAQIWADRDNMPYRIWCYGACHFHVESATVSPPKDDNDWVHIDTKRPNEGGYNWRVYQ